MTTMCRHRSFLLIFLLSYARPPGPAYDLSFSEVRGQSLVILWKAPVYTGASAVTGYVVEMAKKGSSEFATLNQEAVSHRYLQVGGRQKLTRPSNRTPFLTRI